MVFVAPGQIFVIDNKGAAIGTVGYGLLFHPDLIIELLWELILKITASLIIKRMKPLHLSKKERKIITSCIYKILEEINLNIDKRSKTLIVSNIEHLLNYCMRFYDRQFITSTNANKDILVRFENLIKNYFDSDKPYLLGLPSVHYCAEELHLSANYFGDLIKKETDSAAIDYIQTKLIDEAKEKNI